MRLICLLLPLLLLVGCAAPPEVEPLHDGTYTVLELPIVTFPSATHIAHLTVIQEVQDTSHTFLVAFTLETPHEAVDLSLGMPQDCFLPDPGLDVPTTQFNEVTNGGHPLEGSFFWAFDFQQISSCTNNTATILYQFSPKGHDGASDRATFPVVVSF